MMTIMIMMIMIMYIFNHWDNDDHKSLQVVEVGLHEERHLVCDMKWVGPLDFRWVRFLIIMMTTMVIMMTIIVIMMTLLLVCDLDGL